jgi:hypothetical protein
MDESQDQERRHRPKSIDGRPVPPPPEVEWPRATRPPRVEDFIEDPTIGDIFWRFRF